LGPEEHLVDESLRRQRAESSLPALVLGEFTFDNGVTLTSFTDQHPFAYFLLLAA